MPFDEVKGKVQQADLNISEEAYFWLLYYCGVRKSEGFERVAEDFSVTETHVVIDFQQRKKGGAKVPPLKIPLRWYGVDKIVQAVKSLRNFLQLLRTFTVT